MLKQPRFVSYVFVGIGVLGLVACADEPDPADPNIVPEEETNLTPHLIYPSWLGHRKRYPGRRGGHCRRLIKPAIGPQREVS